MFDDFDFEEFVSELNWPKIISAVALVLCGLVFAIAAFGLYMRLSSYDSDLAALDSEIASANEQLNQTNDAEQSSSALLGSTSSSAANAGADLATAQNNMLSASGSQSKALSQLDTTMSQYVDSEQDRFAWASVSNRNEASGTSLSWSFCSSIAFDSTIGTMKVAWKLTNDKTGDVCGWAFAEYNTQTQKFSKFSVCSTDAGRALSGFAYCDGTKSISASTSLSSFLGVA